MNRLAPLTCCLLVAALCAAILGWAVVAMTVAAFCVAFEFLLPGYTSPPPPPDETIEAVIGDGF